MTTHADKHFALFAPPPDDANFQCVRDYLIDTVHRVAWEQRVKCAQACGISVWETEVILTPDPDKPNFVTITAYPRAVVVKR